MPIFDYVCQCCCATTEVLARHADPAPLCTCGAEMQLQMSLCSFRLIGRGWASDGYSTTKPDERRARSNADADA